MAYFVPPVVHPPNLASQFHTIDTGVSACSSSLPRPIAPDVSNVQNAHLPSPPLHDSIDFPIGYHVDHSTKQKNIAGEFVNLAVLLVRNPVNTQSAATLTIDS